MPCAYYVALSQINHMWMQSMQWGEANPYAYAGAYASLCTPFKTVWKDFMAMSRKKANKYS